MNKMMKKNLILSCLVLILALLFFLFGLLAFIFGIIDYVNNIQPRGEDFPFDTICLPFIGFGFLAFLMSIIYIKLRKNRGNNEKKT